jgi:tetratricopeptide (TPR) repeat protein
MTAGRERDEQRRIESPEDARMALNRRARILFLALFCVLGSLGGTASAQQDKIVLKDGKQKVAKILTEDFDGLTYSLEGGSAGLRWEDVDSIRYGSADKYYAAVDLYNAGKLDEALPVMQELAADTKLRPVLRQNVLYFVGSIQERQSKSEEAAATYAQLLKDFPKSRYLLDVGSRLLAIHLARGDATQASRLVDEAVKAAQAAGAAPGMQAGFGLLRGKLLEAQGKFDDASSMYSKTSTEADAAPDVATAAKLGVARCSQGAGRASEAEQRYREIIGLDAPSEVLAGAWNGLGDLSYEPALSKRDPEGLLDGLFAYLRGVVMYAPARGGDTNEYERSLAGASLAFKALGELEKEADKKKTYMDRAKACRDQLARDYPNSIHLKKL